MKMMKHIKSFFIAYFALAVIFYTVDMAAQSSFVDGTLFPFIVLNVLLVAIMVLSFYILLEHKAIALPSPYAAAAGGLVGLLHGIAPYMIIGTFWVWNLATFSGFTAHDKKILLLGLVNPLVNLSDFICDGSIYAVILSGILFFVMARQSKRWGK